jgi:PhzF family phenazine biosynthesis protein
MPQIPFYIVDAFTDTPFQGNPAGVFLLEEEIPEDTMRRLCLELPLESAFILPSNTPNTDFRLRYFVKTHAVTSREPSGLTANVVEVPLCGHATIAALTVLRDRGRLAPGGLQQAATLAGVLQVGITESGEATLRQRSPEFGDPLTQAETDAVTDALGYEPGRGRGIPHFRFSVSRQARPGFWCRPAPAPSWTGPPPTSPLSLRSPRSTGPSAFTSLCSKAKPTA